MTDKLYDPDIRRRLLANKPDRSAARELGYNIPEDTKIKVVSSPSNVLYIALPTEKVDLASISGGAAMTVGTTSSLGTVTSSLSSAATAGTAIIT